MGIWKCENAQLKSWLEWKLDPIPAAAACGGAVIGYCNIAFSCKITFFLNFMDFQLYECKIRQLFRRKKKEYGVGCIERSRI